MGGRKTTQNSRDNVKRNSRSNADIRNRNRRKKNEDIKLTIKVVSVFVIVIVFVKSIISLSNLGTSLDYHLDEKIADAKISANYISILDTNTNEFIYEQNSQNSRLVGSINKLMTIYITYEEIEKGNIKLTDTFTFTDKEAQALGSVVGVNIGDVRTVEELIVGTLLPSGCDYVQALVTMISESEEEFVKKMNTKAKELNLKSTSYANATGIDSDGSFSNAYDVSLLAQALVDKYPQVLEVTENNAMVINDRVYKSTNALMGYIPELRGLKTGSTQLSNYNLVSYIEYDKGGYDASNTQGYIITVLGGDTDGLVFTDTEKIINIIRGIYDEQSE